MHTYRKIKALLSQAEKKKAVGLLCMMFMAMLLETVGLGVIIAFISLMTQPGALNAYPGFEGVMRFFNHPSQLQLVLGGTFALLLLYLVKAAVLMLMSWKRSQFIFNVQSNLSSRLFRGYLEQPWSFHLQKNSAHLVSNVIHEVGFFCMSALQPSMFLIAELFVLLGISLTLLIAEPLGSLVMISVLGSVVWAYNSVLRERISQWGSRRQKYEAYRLQYLQQGLGGIKAAKLLGREEAFNEQFKACNIKFVDAGKRAGVLGDCPRIMLELFAIVSLVCMILVMLAQGKSVEMLAPTVGLFAAAAFRLIPSVNRILTAIQTLRYALPSLDKVSAEMRLVEENAGAFDSGEAIVPLAYEESVVFEHAHYRYADTDTDMLRDISLRIEKGSAIGFIGKSGAGKSTLMDLLLGLLHPNHGRVLVDGTDIQTNLRGWQTQIGYVPQTIFLTDDTLMRNVAFGLSEDEIDEEAVRRAIQAAQLSDFIHTLPEGLQTKVGERGIRLSGGQRQRIGIARALYHNPSVLVLDEATSALDLATEAEVMKDINRLKGEKTLIIVAHRLSTLENCNWIYRLEEGVLVDSGSFSDVIHRQKTSLTPVNEAEEAGR